MNEIGFVIQQRPYPPEWIFAQDTPNFAPAPEIWRWIKSIFLNPEHKLFNPDHVHLGASYYPQIAVMWAKGGFQKQGRFVVGQAEKIMINASGWKKERQEEQFYQWFNDLPDYLITIDATYTSAVAASHTPKQFNKQEDTDVTELEQLKADNQKLTTERDNAVTELKQFKETKRTEDIAALESELKTQFSAEDKTAYTAMDDTTFAFAAKQLRQFSVGGQQTPSTKQSNQTNPVLAHLFTHQANGGQAGAGQAQGSTLDHAFNQFAAAQK